MTVKFDPEPLKPQKPARKFRNPIYIAREWARQIETGQVRSQAGLARKLGISRVRVNQFLRLLKLDKGVMDAVERLGDPLSCRDITERMLRPYIGNSWKHSALEQLRKFKH